MVALPKEFKLFPRYLQEAGYYCCNNSKEDYNVEQPIPTWNDSSGKAHWRNRPDKQPFFAVFNSTASHESKIRSRPHKLLTDPAKVRVPAYHPDTPEVRADWAQYYDIVSAADNAAGKRLAELTADGLTDNTIVFYFGDHGSGMPRSKRWPGDSGLHVPLVVYFPQNWRHLAPKDYQPGGSSDQLVSFVDFAPTILSLAGIKPPSWMQGVAFAGEYPGEKRKYLFGERGRMDECPDLIRSVTDGRYVYLKNFMPQVSQAQHVAYQFQTPTTRIWKQLFDAGKTTPAQSIFWQTPKAPEELYELQSDPDEVNNLANSHEHRQILAGLRTALREHQLKTRDVCLLPEAEMHSRTQQHHQGQTPYELGHDDAAYPLERVLDAAQLASKLDPEATAQLVAQLSDNDSAIRYWAAAGLQMRGMVAVTAGQDALQKALQDPSSSVRVVAATALARYGKPELQRQALKELGELARPAKSGTLTAIAALFWIEELGPLASPLHEQLRMLEQRGAQMPNRYKSFVPQLIRNILEKDGQSKSVPANTDGSKIAPAARSKAK